MDVLILTDLQKDFFEGGALPVKGAEKILPIVKKLLLKFPHVIVVLDWHPKGHVSFASTYHKRVGEKIGNQRLWPEHCLQNSEGASLILAIQAEAYIHKGVDKKIDSYSAFFDNERKKKTALEDYLRKLNYERLFFAGVATDYCVKYSVLDALELGFEVYVIEDAVAGIDLKGGDSKRALEEMQEKGAKTIASSEVLNYFEII